MIRQQFERYLKEEGFLELQSNLQEVSAFVKVENNFINILQLIDYKKNLYLSTEQYEEINEAVKKVFLDRGVSEIHVLNVILAEDIQKARGLFPQDPFCWYIDVSTEQLIIEEGKTPDFYGMKSLIESFLDSYDKQEAVSQEEAEEIETKTGWERFTQYMKEAPKVTLSLVIVNVVIFLLCICGMPFLYEKGETGLAYILQGEWYRLLSATFLHADVDHIFSNMILLYFLGDMIEKIIGKGRFFTLCMLSGILGNVVSSFYEYMTGITYTSIGASGIVYGLIGALLYLVIRKNKDLNISVTRMIIMVAYCIYSSFAGENINAAAHIGGFLAGFLLMFPLSLRRKKHEC